MRIMDCLCKGVMLICGRCKQWAAHSCMDHTNEAQTPNIDDRSGKARGRTGTKGFLAPEVALGMVYSVRADLWSTGVTLFLCLAGRMPIADDMVVPRPHLVNWRLVGQLDHRSVQVLSRLLAYEASRFSAAAAQQHPWTRWGAQRRRQVRF